MQNKNAQFCPEVQMQVQSFIGLCMYITIFFISYFILSNFKKRNLIVLLLQKMSQHIIKELIRNSLIQLKNTHSILGTYLFVNPYIIINKQHMSYSLIDLSQKLEINIKQFDKLLLYYRIAPSILDCEPIKKSLIVCLSFMNTSVPEEIILKKIQNLAQNFNGKIRQLNEKQLQEKQLRGLLISTRNSLQACSKQINAKNNGNVKKNQTVSKIIDYLI